ncbi:MAG: aldehyde dehydrogenase [bacterium]|nr:aldehyde dehydrogenase [bacterium]
MLHVPILRAGTPYRSLNVQRLAHIRTGETVAEVSQANGGLIARDMLNAGRNRDLLRRMPIEELFEICGRAAELFDSAELPIDPLDGVTQSRDEYVRDLSSTTGMPHRLARGNMAKIRFVLEEMPRVLAGLTRGLDLSVLDRGWVDVDGRTVSYIGQADSLGGVLPSNSPGVHSLWIPSLALKVPVVLKPGSQEPWTPMRIAQALIAAGMPPQAFGVYPTDHGGANEILLRTDRSMFFGDESSIRGWKGDPRVQLHGPGWSKILIGEDRIDGWREHIDTIVESIAENGGRSCINASGVWVPRRGREVAEALAERLSRIEARSLDDPEAGLAAFSQPAVAHRISEYVDSLLQEPGAVDLTAELRDGPRVVERDGCTFLLPTLIWCSDPGHALARCELLFPFASVVEAPQDEMLQRIGSTLVVSAITEDPSFRAALMTSREIDRLNLGPLHTSRVSWDQPHEGNLFEHLYKQRSFMASA